MRKGWLIPLILVVVIGVMGFGLTGEKAQKVQKISREPVAAERLGCELEACNPLREEQYPELSETVKDYYVQRGSGKNFIESYDNIRVYTKEGRYAGSYVVFVKYDMKIRDIYTKVPGLGTLYVEKNGTSGAYEIKGDSGDAELKEYVALVSSHTDVLSLIEKTNAEYEAAVDSDALLKEALLDLRNAYEDQT